MKKSLLIIILFFLVIKTIYAGGPYPGTCDGKVYNTEGDFVDSARVVATVNNCILDCIQETTTESSQYHTGYYVTANLPLSKFGAITVYSEKFNPIYNRMEFGYGYGAANEFHAARVDVTICMPPDPPVLVHQPNTHSTSVNLRFTSYPDFKGYSTYDQFQMDSRTIIRSNNHGDKNLDVTSLSFAMHTWRVRTCNERAGQTLCCSNWVSDSFNVGNLPPLPPNLTSQIDTSPGQVTLNWIPGTDPDEDETFDEYNFGIINDLIRTNIINATSPQTEQVFGCNYYTWKVRTCERFSQHLCSAWIDDGFIACGIECPTCTSTSGGGGGGGGASASSSKSYSIYVNSPATAEEEQEIPLKISFQGNSNNLLFKVTSKDFDFNDYLIDKIQGKKAAFNITGRIKPGKQAGIYNFTLDVFANNNLIFSELIDIRIKKPFLINIKEIALEIPKRKTFWPILIILILIGIGIYFYIRYKDKNSKSKQPGFFSKFRFEE